MSDLSGFGRRACWDPRNFSQSQAGTPLESSVAGFSLIAFVLQTTAVLGLMNVRWGVGGFVPSKQSDRKTMEGIDENLPSFQIP